MLRTGELLGLRSCRPMSDSVLISLGLTKGGKRAGAAESVILGVEPVVHLVKRWKALAQRMTPLGKSPANWCGLFSESLSALGSDTFGFWPYSLRRGGATVWFSSCFPQKSARIYINEGLSLLAGMNVPVTAPNIPPYHKVYSQTVSTTNFSTLEPPTDGGRSGGRGGRRIWAEKSK